MEKPKGGAIALGFPLRATGARMCAKLMLELKRTGGKLGVTLMRDRNGSSMSFRKRMMRVLIFLSVELREQVSRRND